MLDRSGERRQHIPAATRKAPVSWLPSGRVGGGVAGEWGGRAVSRVWGQRTGQGRLGGLWTE